jgi:hypothetical protein
MDASEGRGFNGLLLSTLLKSTSTRRRFDETLGKFSSEEFSAGRVVLIAGTVDAR